MDVPIHCPGCQARLHVPADAAGRMARCPKCKSKFRVPDLISELEDTVSGWLVENTMEATSVRSSVREAGKEHGDRKAADEREQPASESVATKSDDQAERWQKLPAPVRKRLSKWFQVMDGERFIQYMPERSLSKFDHGIAGVVVTDQRVVYCRNKQQGSLHLDAYGEMILMHDGPCYDLFYHHDNQEVLLVQLRPDDARRFAEAVNAQEERLRVLLEEQ